MEVTNKAKKIGVLTSGGDAQGMNAAVRAITRTALRMGMEVYAIKWGYQGLIDGGDNIFRLKWEDVDFVMHLGGTFIGSARCSEFRERSGRQKAALNLIKLGVTGLVVIGGDGSLSGAEIFRTEWPDHVSYWVEQQKNDKSIIFDANSLIKTTFSIVGIIGSIDNDFYDSDMTIGADSALHRIIECVDSISTTAKSHKRVFVLEVMGRNSGYLALISGLAVGADYVFVPEYAPADATWQQQLVQHVKDVHATGKNYAIIIVAEGALTSTGQPIKSQQICQVLTDQLHLDCRVTVLGHVQRGGTPSAFDRVLATRFGIESVISLLRVSQLPASEQQSMVVCLQGGKICLKSLVECVKGLSCIKEAFKSNDYERLAELRGGAFQRNMQLFKLFSTVLPSDDEKTQRCNKTFGVFYVGAPAAGCNAAVRSFVRYCKSRGYCCVGFENGLEGLVNNKFVNLDWSTVEDWHSEPGTILGSSRLTVSTMNEKLLAESLIRYEKALSGFLFLGGYDALKAMDELKNLFQKRDDLKMFRDRPMALIPCTMSNSFPKTFYTVGSDSTVNVIMRNCDNLISSSRSYKGKIYVVETMGKRCGYLATLSGIASAAQSIYIHEKPTNLASFTKNTNILKNMFRKNPRSAALFVMSDEASPHYKVDTVCSIIDGECGEYSTGVSIRLGHVQQGCMPSPFDRITAIKFGFRASLFLIHFFEKSEENFGDAQYAVLCQGVSGMEYLDMGTIIDNSEIKNRRSKHQNWLDMVGIVDMLSGCPFSYTSEILIDGKEYTVKDDNPVDF